MPEASALIEVEHVFKTYPAADRGDRLVLEDVNFRLVPGEIVAVLGKSGSGKSTFLRIIAGLSEPSNGEVRYRGKDGQGPGARRRDGVPELRAVPVADRAGQCRAGAGGAERAEGRAAQARRGGDRSDRAGRVRNPPIRRSCRAACASASVLPGRW